MLGRLLAWIGVPGAPIADYGGLRPGAVQIDGTLQTSTPIASPILERDCAGFHYRARFSATRVIRGSQTGQRTLRTATVYAPGLVLRMNGGDVRLQPVHNEEFSGQ